MLYSKSGPCPWFTPRWLPPVPGEGEEELARWDLMIPDGAPHNFVGLIADPTAFWRPQTYYFTFANNCNLTDNFIKVKASNYESAREIMYSVYDSDWSFQYDEQGFAGIAERFNLTEVPLGTELHFR